jgi:DNA polymerase-1
MFTMGDLEYEHKATGVIFGFLLELLGVAEVFKSKTFAFCFDSQKSFRRDLFPEYKRRNLNLTSEDRELREICFPQFTELRQKTLHKLGFGNVFIQTGLEADDLIAKIVLQYNLLNPVVISSDEDLYQLLNFCEMYKLASKSMYGEEEFKQEWNLEPEQWQYVKAIAGCKSDNVPGVDGVGEASAAEFLRGTMKAGGKRYNDIKGFQSCGGIEQNLDIVRLPHPATKPVSLYADEPFTKYNFMDVFQQYGFTSQIGEKQWGKWVNTFGLQ